MSKTMRYIEVAKSGGPEVLTLRKGPVPAPAEGEVVVEVKAAGVNFFDLFAIAGNFPPLAKRPMTPGFEAAGVVSAVGDNVTSLQVGDRVAALTFAGGGYASHAVFPAASLIPLPPALTFENAAALLVQGAAALLVLEQVKVGPNDTVIVGSAAGGLGLLATQIARLKGARVVGLAAADKHDVVRRSGAQVVVDYRKPGWSREIVEATKGEGASVFLDSIGDWGSEVMDALGHNARWITYGVRGESQAGMRPDVVWKVVDRHISLRGFNMEGYASDIPRALTQILAWAVSGSLELFVKSYALADAVMALTDFASRRTVGKVVLVP